MKVDIAIQHAGLFYYPAVEEGVDLEWDRAGAPGKLTFSVVKDDKLSFGMGDPVKLEVDGVLLFYGFVFKKTRSGQKPWLIKVMAYDQLRYFKNKDTYVYENKTAAEVVHMLAEDFRLSVGELADTGYKIPSMVEEDKTLFDIVQDALDETLRMRGRLYVLYDDAGKLVLRDVEHMKLDLLLDASRLGDFDYGSSIDDRTYNQVKVIFENKDARTRDIYMARSGENINRWGLLQLTDKVEDAANGQAKADALLKLYNAESRTLTAKDVLGDLRVRAGSSVIVQLELGDMTVRNHLMAEQVKHRFENETHLMTLKLRGGTFVA